MIGEGFQNIFKIPELKKRIFYTFALLSVYRIGVHVPTPGIDTIALASFFARAKGTLLGLFDMFSGGALERLSVFALGIMPYISASIILQLLAVVMPAVERMQKEGEQGRPDEQATGRASVRRRRAGIECRLDGQEANCPDQVVDRILYFSLTPGDTDLHDFRDKTDPGDGYKGDQIV